jgi:hypothetical protein
MATFRKSGLSKSFCIPVLTIPSDRWNWVELAPTWAWDSPQTLRNSRKVAEKWIHRAGQWESEFQDTCSMYVVLWGSPIPTCHLLQDLKEQGRKELLVPQEGMLWDFPHPDLHVSTGCALFSKGLSSDTQSVFNHCNYQNCSQYQIWPRNQATGPI